MSKTEATIIAPALANGATGKASVHCRRSLDIAAGRTKPRADPKPTTPAKPKAVKTVSAPKATGAGIINSAGRIVLKANKEVRAALKAAAVAAGGSRLQPIGFDDFSCFLNGFDAAKDATTVVTFQVPVKGKDAISLPEVTLKVAKDGSWTVA